MKRLALALFAVLSASAHVSADPEPRGPADLVGSARKARDARELKEAGQRAASAGPDSPASTPRASAGTDPHAEPHASADEGEPSDAQHAEAQHGSGDDAPAAPRLSEERADPSLPSGTIRVHVRDPHGASVGDADLELAIMAADGNRTTKTAHSSSDGVATFTGLTGGERQAYRVNLHYEGAKYSSSPFRLPLSGGYVVELLRLPVTKNDRMIVTYVGAISVELKDDRMKVVQQTRLMNVGRETYVFPAEGKLIRLPEGFMAVQIQESMTDQHVAESKGEGLRVRGSLPPGEATMLWAFDLPVSGSAANFAIDMPWLVFTYRVITDAPEGMHLHVDGMPEPEEHRDQGRRYWVTETQRRVGDPPFRRVQIALTGIPGQGTARWVAAMLALCTVIAGAFVAGRLPDRRSNRNAVDFEAYKQDVLERVKQLDAQHAAGEVGPEYHREQMAALEDELAELLYEQAELKKPPASGRVRSSSAA